jgi:hypothetical protein
MLRHVPQPLYARGLETDVGGEATRYRVVNDNLILLLQQLDQLLLGAYVAPDLSVIIVEKTDDGVLFGEGWHEGLKPVKIIRIKPEPTFHHTGGNRLDACLVSWGAKQVMEKPRPRAIPEAVNALGGADDTMELRNAHASVPGEHDIHYKFVRFYRFVADKRFGSSIRFIKSICPGTLSDAGVV